MKAGLLKRKHRMAVGCIITIDGCNSISSPQERTNLISPMMSPAFKMNGHINM